MSYWSWLLEKSLFNLFQTSYKQIQGMNAWKNEWKLASQPTPNLFPSEIRPYDQGLLRETLWYGFGDFDFQKKTAKSKTRKTWHVSFILGQ